MFGMTVITTIIITGHPRSFPILPNACVGKAQPRLV
jgi:hypothetical protein